MTAHQSNVISGVDSVVTSRFQQTSFSCPNFFWVHAPYVCLSFRLFCRRITKVHALKCLAPWFYNRTARGTVPCTKVLGTYLLCRYSTHFSRWPGEFDSSTYENPRCWCVSTSSFIFPRSSFSYQPFSLAYNYRIRTSDLTDILQSHLLFRCAYPETSTSCMLTRDNASYCQFSTVK